MVVKGVRNKIKQLNKALKDSNEQLKNLAASREKIKELEAERDELAQQLKQLRAEIEMQQDKKKTIVAQVAGVVKGAKTVGRHKKW